MLDQPIFLISSFQQLYIEYFSFEKYTWPFHSEMSSYVDRTKSKYCRTDQYKHDCLESKRSHSFFSFVIFPKRSCPGSFPFSSVRNMRLLRVFCSSVYPEDPAVPVLLPD